MNLDNELIDELNEALGLGEDQEDGGDIVWDSLEVPEEQQPAEVLSEVEAEPAEQETLKAKVGGGMSFFTQRRAVEEEFPDIIEEVELETVVLKEPEPFTQGISDEDVEAMWTDVLAQKHKLTADDVKRLLVEESARLKVENYVFDDIDVNPKKLPEEVILAEVRDMSLTSLMLNYDTQQFEIDVLREIRAKREALQKARGGVSQKSVIKKGLPFHLGGEMTQSRLRSS